MRGKKLADEPDRPGFDREGTLADIRRRIRLVCKGEMDINPPGVEDSEWATRKRQLKTGLFYKWRK
jgi:hypothetical protein